MKKTNFWDEVDRALKLLINSDTLIALQKVSVEISSNKKRALQEHEIITVILEYLDIDSREIREIVYKWLMQNRHRFKLDPVTKEELITILNEKVDKSYLKYLNATSVALIEQVLEQLFANLYGSVESQDR